MKSLYITALLIGSAMPIADVHAQRSEVSSLEKIPLDTNRVLLLLNQGNAVYFSKPDSCLVLTNQALELAQKLNFEKGMVWAFNQAGESLRFLGEFPASLEMQYRALKINRSRHDQAGEATSMGFIGFTYVELGEYRQGLHFLFQAKKINESLSDKIISCFDLSNIGNAYELMNMPDSALFFQQQAYTISVDLPIAPLRSLVLTRLGIVHYRSANYSLALQNYHDALRNSYSSGDMVNLSKIQNRIAESYLAINQNDSSFYYARLSFASGQQVSQKLQILEASDLLVKLFRKKNMPDSIIHYQDIAIAMKDSLYGPEKFKQLQYLMLSEQQQQQAIQQEHQQYKNKTRLIALAGLLGVFFLIAILLQRNIRHKQKANILLQHQKNEIQTTLMELRSAQKQLIQSEKMASLGELTAGIAHEIQNPLNFVNNFSEVNKEMLVEMREEIEKKNFDEVNSIAKDVEENEEKIIFHGKRADAIVKGMLQHSRSSSGVKEPADINALTDEYLRLAYHGLRAKDKSFNVTMKTDFDQSIGKINIVPQDIGRVILNLITNAFYAAPLPPKGGFSDPDYKHNPTVWVSTKKMGDKVLISVRDNGPGIPQEILDKIFQPFFTTKPTGQGTGLGLSLSYDIVKAHSGELKLETKEGEGTEFIIQLPVA